MTARGGRGRGELETEVMDALQAAGLALTAAELRERLTEDLAYTTVLTILVRLRGKGLLERERRGRAYAYRPVSDQAGLTARRMRHVLDEGPDRDSVLARFVDTLSEDDERALRRLLGEDR